MLKYLIDSTKEGMILMFLHMDVVYTSEVE